jgi:hypothetical protein
VSVVPGWVWGMTITPLDARFGVLDAARSAVAARMRAEVDLLVEAAKWGLLHPATEASGVAGYGERSIFGEDIIALAGDGAPLVAEFAPAELAAVLGWSTEVVQELMSDAMDLVCRMPEVCADVLALRTPVHLGRYMAQQAHDLDADLAGQADRMLAGGGKLTRRMIKRVVDDIRLHDDPDRAVAEEANALASRRVEILPGLIPATLDVTMTLDVPDGEAFGGVVSRLAEALKTLGDTDDVDVRRARAVGILADPQAALALLTGHDVQPSTATAGTVNLDLHLDLATLADLAVHGVTGPVQAGRYGTATTDLVKEWLTTWLPDAKITVRPYRDLSEPGSIRPVDGHDPPEQMAWYVRLRDPVCVFPGCTQDSRRCDLDHIEAYLSPDDGGPPGQTHPENLAPLCRRHHRAKTHGQWSYHRLPDAGYRWTTPTGRVIDVPPARRPHS